MQLSNLADALINKGTAVGSDAAAASVGAAPHAAVQEAFGSATVCKVCGARGHPARAGFCYECGSSLEL